MALRGVLLAPANDPPAISCEDGYFSLSSIRIWCAS